MKEHARRAAQLVTKSGELASFDGSRPLCCGVYQHRGGIFAAPVESVPIGEQTTLQLGYDTFSDTEAINVVAKKKMLERLGCTGTDPIP